MPWKNLARRREWNKEYAELNKLGMRAYQREWRLKNKERLQIKNAADYRKRKLEKPEVIANSKFKTLYGITLEEYRQMLQQQNGLCAVCKRPETAVQNGKVRKLSVDHNHKTGVTRELLCHCCNTAVGHLKEDPMIAQAITEYLAKWINNG